jgi:hypothetical protein
MDKIRLAISQADYGGVKVDVVDIYINERNLIDILKEYEMHFALAENHPDIAGGYMGMSPREVFYPSKNFLGGELFKTTILVCGGCGEPGCWDFKTRITISDDKVIWSDFEQTHRRPDSKASYWNYDKLGPFIFHRKQYESELRKPQ